MKTMVWSWFQLSKITLTAGHVFIDLKITFLFSTSGALKGSFSFEKVISCSEETTLILSRPGLVWSSVAVVGQVSSKLR